MADLAGRHFSPKEFNIVKPKDLEGQSVAFDVGSGDFQLWPAFVKATGIDDSKVNEVTMDAAALIKALAEKQAKAEGNFFGSIAPSLWAQGMEINSVLYTDYGIKMLSNVVACKRSTIEKRPDLCKHLNPDESVEMHIDSVKEFKGSSVTNQKVIEYGQAVSTALGMVPAFKEHAGIHGARPGRADGSHRRDLYGREVRPQGRNAVHE